MLKKLFCFILMLFTSQAFSQLRYSLGLGASSSVFVLQVQNHEATPLLPVSPNVTARLKKHEILIGTDIYFVPTKSRIYGMQAAYHFYPSVKKRKWFDYYIDAGVQYVKFKMGSFSPDPYNSSDDFHVADGALVKYKSLINTYGIGTVFKIKDRINIFGAIGVGINYWEQQVVVNHSSDEIKNGGYTGILYYAKLGMTLKLFNKYESSCAGYPQKNINHK